MKRTISNVFTIGLQLLIVFMFFGYFIKEHKNINEYVMVVHNGNLNKIADSVSILFQAEDKINLISDEYILEDLPAINVAEGKEQDNSIIEEITNEEVNSTPLISLDSSKYSSKESMGFKVTENNKEYDLNGYDFDVVVAVVAGEFDKTLDDALGVVSVILNRCDSPKWSKWGGSSPYDQVIRKGQFEVYFSGAYLKYMPNGRFYGSSKYEIAKQAVVDGLNGIRNNEYLGFRAWWVTSYSNKYIVNGGNRYGNN